MLGALGYTSRIHAGFSPYQITPQLRFTQLWLASLPLNSNSVYLSPCIVLCCTLAFLVDS